MRTPTEFELLNAWEAGAALAGQDRSLPLLLAAGLDVGVDLAELSLGERDRLLLAIRERLFGDVMTAIERCPRCGDALELTIPAQALLAAPSVPEAVHVEGDGYDLHCRPLRPADLAVAAQARLISEARSILIARCITGAEHEGRSVAVSDIPGNVVAAVADALAAADPLANVELPVACEGCGAGWTARLDIAAYLWKEIDSWAARTLRAVDSLARAYGWGEREILALSAHRRNHYLELVTSG